VSTRRARTVSCRIVRGPYVRGSHRQRLAGLKPSQLQALERLYRRRVTPTEVVSAELASYLAELSAAMHRQVGVLIDRRGSITHVVVGDASKIVLPDIGRLRGAAGRFRGVRLVHTHLRGESLTRDDLTDLALLRLDLVAAIVVDDRRAPRQAVRRAPPARRPRRSTVARAARRRRCHAPAIDFTSADRRPRGRLRPRAASRRHRGAWRRARAGGPRGDRSGHRLGEARIAEIRELCRTAGVEVARRGGPAAAGGRSQVPGRARQARRDLAARDAARRRARGLRSRPDAGPGPDDQRQHRAASVVDRTMLILDIFAQHADQPPTASCRSSWPSSATRCRG
jgi:GTP-binding protein HflX